MFTDRYTWGLTWTLGLRPADVIGSFRVWELGTYMFLHAGLFHILFNMLALWMFGTELERIWGTPLFSEVLLRDGHRGGRVDGIFLVAALRLCPTARAFHRHRRVGCHLRAAARIWDVLPDRPIYMYLVFPIPARYFVMIMGAMAFYSSIAERGGVANATHLGGLLVAYLFLKSGRMHPWAEVKYRYLKWKINRTRAKFDVYTGGRATGGRENDWDRRVH